MKCFNDKNANKIFANENLLSEIITTSCFYNKTSNKADYIISKRTNSSSQGVSTRRYNLSIPQKALFKILLINLMLLIFDCKLFQFVSSHNIDIKSAESFRSFRVRKCSMEKKSYTKNYLNNFSQFATRKSFSQSYNEISFEKMRIHFDYSYTLPYEEKMLKELIIPPVKKFFENTLSVRRIPGRIRIPSTIQNCQGSPIPDYLYQDGADADLIILISTYRGVKKYNYEKLLEAIERNKTLKNPKNYTNTSLSNSDSHSHSGKNLTLEAINKEILNKFLHNFFQNKPYKIDSQSSLYASNLIKNNNKIKSSATTTLAYSNKMNKKFRFSNSNNNNTNSTNSSNINNDYNFSSINHPSAINITNHKPSGNISINNIFFGNGHNNNFNNSSHKNYTNNNTNNSSDVYSNDTNALPWEINDGPADVVGWSSYCLQDLYTLRPVFGIMQYVADIEPTPRAIEEAIWTTLHEFTHILGMDYDLYSDFIDNNMQKKGYKGTIKIKTKLKGLETLMKKRAKYFNDLRAFVEYEPYNPEKNATYNNNNTKSSGSALFNNNMSFLGKLKEKKTLVSDSLYEFFKKINFKQSALDPAFKAQDTETKKYNSLISISSYDKNNFNNNPNIKEKISIKRNSDLSISGGTADSTAYAKTKTQVQITQIKNKNKKLLNIESIINSSESLNNLISNNIINNSNNTDFVNNLNNSNVSNSIKNYNTTNNLTDSSSDKNPNSENNLNVNNNNITHTNKTHNWAPDNQTNPSKPKNPTKPTKPGKPTKPSRPHNHTHGNSHSHSHNHSHNHNHTNFNFNKNNTNNNHTSDYFIKNNTNNSSNANDIEDEDFNEFDIFDSNNTKLLDFNEVEFLYNITQISLPVSEDYIEINFPSNLNITTLLLYIKNFAENTRFYIKTDNVVQAGRKHFNCKSLDGVELEHFGGLGSAYSHWSKRILNTEFMIADSYGENNISNFTLALLDDSGWYKVDYSKSQDFLWGKNKGCGFLTDKCIVTTQSSKSPYSPGLGTSLGLLSSEIKNNNFLALDLKIKKLKKAAVDIEEEGQREAKELVYSSNNKSNSDFTNRNKNKIFNINSSGVVNKPHKNSNDIDSLVTERKIARSISVAKFKEEFCVNPEEEQCSISKVFRGFCSLKSWNKAAIPQQYQYFEDPNLAGNNFFGDYCPYTSEWMDELTYKPIGSCKNGISLRPELGEKICENCRCFVSSLVDEKVYENYEKQIKKIQDLEEESNTSQTTEGDTINGKASASLDFLVFNMIEEMGKNLMKKLDKNKAMCYETKCRNEKNKVFLYVIIEDLEIKCPRKGGVLSIEGYKGFINCPNVESVCIGALDPVQQYNSTSAYNLFSHLFEKLLNIVYDFIYSLYSK